MVTLVLFCFTLNENENVFIMTFYLCVFIVWPCCFFTVQMQLNLTKLADRAGLSGNSSRLNQSNSISSYVTLRRGPGSYAARVSQDIHVIMKRWRKFGYIEVVVTFELKVFIMKILNKLRCSFSMCATLTVCSQHNTYSYSYILLKSNWLLNMCESHLFIDSTKRKYLLLNYLMKLCFFNLENLDQSKAKIWSMLHFIYR